MPNSQPDPKPKSAAAGLGSLAALISIVVMFATLPLVKWQEVRMSASSKENAGQAATLMIDPTKILCAKFMGFGVEWDSAGYNAAGVTDADFAVIRRRVEWMRLPVARIMVQARWCYQGAGRYDWDSPQMAALYRHLDVCQSLGTTVLLTDWGIEPAWLKTPDVSRVEDPKYAEIVTACLHHLLITKKYTCIKYFILVNEPDLEVKEWHRWKAAIENVAAALRKKGLDQKVTLLGSDKAGGDEWHNNAVDQLQGALGGYDLHRYASEDAVRAGVLYGQFKADWDYALAKDPNAKTKPLIVGEAGFWTAGSDAASNPLHLEHRYGILMSDYAVQAVNAGSWSVVAWMLDDNSHAGFTWGMCKSRKEGSATKPWFYTWSLLCRYFRPGASIVQAQSSSPDVRVLAACENLKAPPEKQAWSFCIVNRSDAPITIRLSIKDGPRLSLKRYLYSGTSATTDKDGFPVALDNLGYDLSAGAELACEANGVLVMGSDVEAPGVGNR